MFTGLQARPAGEAEALQSTNGGWSWTSPGTTVQLDVCCGAFTWYADATRSATLPSGLVVRVGVSGNVYLSATDQPMTARGGQASHFSNSAIVSSTGVQIATADDRVGCAYGTLCANRGTVTVSFSRPVTNPIVSITGLGGGASDGLTTGSKTVTWTELTLTTPAVSATRLAGGNLTVSGNRIEPTIKNPSTSCSSNNTTYATTANAACGSIQLVGTGSSFSFSADLGSVCNAACYTGPNDIEDAWTMLVSVEEDFGTAPASYDVADGASHVVGDASIGPAVSSTADEVTLANGAGSGAVSPNAGATDGADDGFNVPPMFPASGDYSVTVPLAGVTRPAKLCGWIDTDASGTFEATERVCSDVNPAETSTSVTWPSASVSGIVAPAWMRLRLSYDLVGVESPTGRLDSGEVEDWLVSLFTQSAPQPVVLPPALAPLVSVPVQPISTTTVPPVSTTTTVPPNPTTTVPPVSTTTPAPVLGADGLLPELGNGQTMVTDDGQVLPVELVVENDEALVLRRSDFELRLRGECATGCTIRQEADGGASIELERDGRLEVSGFGFLPGSAVHVWLSAGTRYLGALDVDADGTYGGTFPLDGLEPGVYTLQANGRSADNLPRSANLGFVVADRAAPAPGTTTLPSTGAAGPSVVAWAAALALAGALLTTGARRRRGSAV